MKKLLFTLFAALAFVACDKGGDDTPKPIELTNGTETSQTIFADETEKSEGIKFNATAPWTATVSDVAMRSGSDVEWLTLNAYEGKAGEQTLTLTLLPNTTGLDRKAEIKISCDGTTITITIEQKGVTQSGEKPEPTSTYITAAGKITGGEILGNMAPTEVRWEIERMDEYDPESIVSSNPVSYANKNFDLSFPTPESKVLSGFMPSDATTKPTITPADTKFTGGIIDCLSAEGNAVNRYELNLTNISVENLKHDYLVKKGEGYVRFVYATKAVVVDGLLNYSGDDETYKFSNCQFRQGWNEMMMVAEADASVSGSVIINVTTNNATSDFKWVAQSGDIPSSDKLITKIEEIDNRTDGVRGSQLYEFFYDNSNRVNKIELTETEIEGVGSAEKTTTWISTGVITYASNTVSYNWTQTKNGVPVKDVEDKGEITLDNNGRAISGKGSYIEEKSYNEEIKYTYSLEYNSDGYLSKSERIDSYRPNETRVEKLTWTNGNLTQVWWGSDYIDKAIYGSVLNKTNLDLNWFFETGLTGPEGFAFACGDDENVFSILGYMGKRAKNLVEQLSDGYNGITDFMTKNSYTVDTDGYPIMIEQSRKQYFSGENNQSFEWVKGMPYKITYNK